MSTSKNAAQSFFQGYANSIAGNKLVYHSPIMKDLSSLLLRSRKEFGSIEWQTETVPKNFDREFAGFVWLFGLDVTPEPQIFRVLIDGQKMFEFSNPVSDEMQDLLVESASGSTLLFKPTMIDKYNDLMGFAILKLNKKFIEPGKPVNIKIIGENAGRNTWYMTFESSLNTEPTIEQIPALVKSDNVLLSPINIKFFHLGETKNINISVDGLIEKGFSVRTGFNSLELLMPETTKIKEYSARIKMPDGETKTVPFELKPVKKWTVYLVQHSHTDIGYTRPQSEILPEHLRFIDFALDYCDETDGYPDEAKFRWTCEASWPVFQYLKFRPQKQIERLINRIREGRIEVTGMYFNYSEIVDEASLAAQLEPLLEFKRAGIPVVTAQQDDVNGIGWCLTDYFSGAGIKFVVMGEHGHRALLPFDKPTPFWWLSPSGNKVLAFRAEHYMLGNKLGVHTNDLNTFKSNLMNYLNDLDSKLYLLDRASIQFSGYVTDNSPPSTYACDLVKEWNEKFEYPKLRLATSSEFMRYIEDHHAEDIPKIRAAWPDWWTDGAASAARELAVVRKTSQDFIAAKSLLSMSAIMGKPVSESLFNMIDQIQESLLFYDEHTYTAAESISDPDGENTLIQWGQKSSYAWEAAKKTSILTEAAIGLIQGGLHTDTVPTATFFNTLNWARSGISKVYIDHQILPLNKVVKVVDEAGKEINFQPISSREDGTYWAFAAEDIPPFGFKTYKIIVSDSLKTQGGRIEQHTEFENDYYKIFIRPDRFGIFQIFDKSSGKELVDDNNAEILGELIYERLENRNQLENLKIENPRRTTPVDVRYIGIERGKIWTSIFFRASLPECAENESLQLEVRLFNLEKKIEFHYSIKKLAVTEPEALYAAFPFNIENWKMSFEVQGGRVRPGKDQIEGTASDWNTFQNFVALENDELKIILTSDEIPLVQLGGVNTGKFNYISNPQNPYVYSWIMNNYWVTNFLASQSGEFKWSYSMTSGADKDTINDARFGMNERTPIFARVMPAGKPNDQPAVSSFLNLENENLIAVSFKPIEYNKLLLHIRETKGLETEIDLNTLFPLDSLKIYESNVLGEKISGRTKLLIKPFEPKFIIVELNKN